MTYKIGQTQFVVFGFVFLLFTVVFSSASISNGVFPNGPEVVLFGVSVMAFCNAYLLPHFKANDEKSQHIKQKGMFTSYFFILGFMAILMVLFGLGWISLNGFQTVSILAGLTIMTVFLSFVFYAKKL